MTAQLVNSVVRIVMKISSEVDCQVMAHQQIFTIGKVSGLVLESPIFSLSLHGAQGYY